MIISKPWSSRISSRIWASLACTRTCRATVQVMTARSTNHSRSYSWSPSLTYDPTPSHYIRPTAALLKADCSNIHCQPQHYSWLTNHSRISVGPSDIGRTRLRHDIMALATAGAAVRGGRAECRIPLVDQHISLTATYLVLP